MALPAGPGLYELIKRPPAAQVEITHAEVGVFRHLERPLERWKKAELNVIKNTGQRYFPLINSNVSTERGNPIRNLY